MWTTFCDLALHGGPPQRGALQALRGPAVGDRAARSAPEIAAELRRGIEETTGLAAEAAEPGWIAITCASPRMAAWLCAAIILENVDARAEGPRLLVPAGPAFALEDQVKSVVTVVAKTHHYWREHLESARETRS
jgi:sirohydrochlorin cobaltochelatase